MKRTAALLVLSLLSPVAAAEQAQKFSDIEVHYNAMPTDELLPEVAKTYRIDRSRNRGLLTISVLKKNNLGIAQPVRATVTANAVNLNATLAKIEMREIREGPAIYYLGEFRVTPPDTLKFNVSVTPEGASAGYKVEFQREFYR